MKGEQGESRTQSYRDLRVWQAAVEFGLAVYGASGGFPKHETYGLVSQMRRALVSVASSIAEGNGRRYPREYLQFLSIARGSLAEAETCLEFAARLGYVEADEAHRLFDQSAAVGRQLQALIRSIESKIERSP